MGEDALFVLNETGEDSSVNLQCHSFEWRQCMVNACNEFMQWVYESTAVIGSSTKEDIVMKHFALYTKLTATDREVNLTNLSDATTDENTKGSFTTLLFSGRGSCPLFFLCFAFVRWAFLFTPYTRFIAWGSGTVWSRRYCQNIKDNNEEIEKKKQIRAQTRQGTLIVSSPLHGRRSGTRTHGFFCFRSWTRVRAFIIFSSCSSSETILLPRHITYAKRKENSHGGQSTDRILTNLDILERGYPQSAHPDLDGVLSFQLQHW